MDSDSGPTQAFDMGEEPVEEEPEGKKIWGRLVSLSPKCQNVDLVDSEVVLGRSKACSVPIASPYVSTQHCRVFKEDGVGETLVFVQDLSSNGTFINGDKLGKGNRILIQSGAQITLIQSAQEKIAFVYQFCNDSDQNVDPNDPSRVYEVLHTLGSGNFATVKLAVHKETGEKWALKVIDKKRFSIQSANRPTALMDEVAILKKVKHPNIIGISETFDTEKSLHIVLELVTGGELFDQIIQLKGFPEDRARGVFKQILDGVAYLHRQGIAHRDLKPENILLKSKDCDLVKISDFGLSRVIGEGSFAKTMCGTPTYLAPEILTNTSPEEPTGGYGLACDNWSLGVILYFMLSGRPPFYEGNDNSKAIFDQIRLGTFSFSDPSWKKISDKAKHLIRALIVVDPMKRATAEQALTHPWITGEEFPPQKEEPVPQPLQKSDSFKENIPPQNQQEKKVENGQKIEQMVTEEQKQPTIPLQASNTQDNKSQPVIPMDLRKTASFSVSMLGVSDIAPAVNEISVTSFSQPLPELTKSTSNPKTLISQNPADAQSSSATAPPSNSSSSIAPPSNSSSLIIPPSNSSSSIALPSNSSSSIAPPSNSSSLIIPPSNLSPELLKKEEKKVDTNDQQEDNRPATTAAEPAESKNSSSRTPTLKRSRSNTSSGDPAKDSAVKKAKLENKPICKYGSGCYRKNPSHFSEFRHPSLEDQDAADS